MKKFIKIINILLVIICAIIIFLFSSETAKESTKTSVGTTKSVINTVTNNRVSESKVNEIANKEFTLVRKSAHAIEYFILGFLVINSLKDYKPINYKYLVLCILFCFIYSVSDEIHQIYVPGRSCELKDVLIDSGSSTFGIIIYKLFLMIKK